MIVDLQHRWHILMMDGAAKAGGHPAAIVHSLIKWQIVAREICICHPSTPPEWPNF